MLDDFFRGGNFGLSRSDFNWGLFLDAIRVLLLLLEVCDKLLQEQVVKLLLTHLNDYN